jgi:hypothetical protein
MYNEQLEKLIELALADGHLTQKEKQVLFKKAESMSVDIDEFEMVLDARIFQLSEKTNNQNPPKQEKFGDINKCPSCGSIIQSLNTKCADCGYDFKNIGSINSIREFFKDYQELESKVIMKTNKIGGLIGNLVGNMDDGGDWKRAVYTKKKEYIMHFPIPNTKEDLLEFLMLAYPLALPAKKSTFSGLKKFGAHFGADHAKDFEFMIAEVWVQKCEQIIMKARFSMKEDKKTLEQIEEFGIKLGIKK